MAANAMWLTGADLGHRKAMLWAHNSHLAREQDGWNIPLGAHLARTLAQRYVVIGSYFGAGTVRAWDTREQDKAKLSVLPIDVGPAPKGFVGSTLLAVDLTAFALDMGDTVAPELLAWLKTPHPVRDISAVFGGNESTRALLPLADHFDILLFVRNVQATSTTKTGLRGPLSR